MANPHPKIDFTQLSYPSDQLTIKTIRSVHPNLFAQEEPLFFEGADADVSGMLMIERQLAHRAFAAVLRRRGQAADSDQDRRELILMLADSYRLYGLSSGVRHTYQLVRDIEQAAVAQAKTQLGAGRA